MKREYNHLTTSFICLECKSPILAGSVQTELKDFNVTTANYEIREDDWYGKKSTFSINFD